MASTDGLVGDADFEGVSGDTIGGDVEREDGKEPAGEFE